MPDTNTMHRPWNTILPAIMAGFLILTGCSVVAASHDKSEACSWARAGQVNACSNAYDDAGRIGVAQLQSEAR